MIAAGLDPYDPARVSRTRGRAVVLGASIAGLLAARVLADAFEQVTVVDRDPLDDETQARRGVPQGRHVHVLLRAGQLTIEDLLPGFTDDLVAAGALRLDFGHDVLVVAGGAPLATQSVHLPIYYATRPLLEEVVRARVADLDRVTLWPNRQVTDPLAGSSPRTVTGVTVVADGRPQRIPADLVVDATGRSPRSHAWLQQLGCPVPTTESVQVELAYRTCQVRRPPDDRRAMLVLPSPPQTRGAAVTPVEKGRWLVTLFGMHGDHPPADHEGLKAYAATLATPDVRELLDEHELVTDQITHHRFPSSTRRRYDQLAQHPAGLLAIGDAVASFNPIYGQGMSVAALQALALHHSLADRNVDTIAPDFHERARHLVDNVWQVAAGADFAFPGTTGPKPAGTDLINRYVQRLHRQAHHDSRLGDAFARVAMLERNPTSLLHPSVAWRVLRPGARHMRARRPA